uniref:Uncharacterized protein n=1 Tax=Rhizophora mucronata TaxID=61149 RepID=A0A2P2QY10_RHIMU
MIDVLTSPFGSPLLQFLCLLFVVLILTVSIFLYTTDFHYVMNMQVDSGGSILILISIKLYGCFSVVMLPEW